MAKLRVTGRREAFSLVEVLIAGALLSMLTVSIVGSINFSSRATRVNTNRLTAKNIAQGFFERMASDDFPNVGPPSMGGAYATIPYDDPQPVWLDQNHGIASQVTFDFTGFGVAEGGGVTTLVDNQANWESDEWRGDTLFLVDGKGRGQFVTIDSNSKTTLNFGETLAVGVDATTKYMINNGKTVRITTEWEFLGKTHAQTIQSLIINVRNNPNLGF